MAGIATASTKARRFNFWLFVLLLTPVGLLILAGGWYIATTQNREKIELIEISEVNSVVLGARRLDHELDEPLRQLRTLAEEAGARIGAGGAEKSLSTLFGSLIAYNQRYDRVRWIDDDGQERLRVNNVAGRPVQVDASQLQSKSGMYFVRESASLKPGDIYISPMDLDVEHGVVEEPYKPMLHLVTPLVDGSGVRHGMLVFNIAAQAILDNFTESVLTASDHVSLLNREGYWLRHPVSALEWGFMLDRNENTLAHQNPDAWKLIDSMLTGQYELADGLWTWSTVYPLKAGNDQHIATLPTWLIVAHVPDEQLAAVRAQTWKNVGSYAAVLLVLYGLLAAWMTRVVQGRASALADAATARAEADAARQVQQVQERCRLIVEGATIGLLVVDKDARITLANPALLHMFGYASGELLGKPLDCILPEDARARHGQQLNAYLNNPKARPMGAGLELRGQRKDGSVFPIEVSLSPFVENGELFVDAFVVDISERKRSQQLHKRIEARLQLMMQTNPNGILVVDDEGAIEMANPALERMFGYGPGELFNQPLERLVPKDLRSQHAQLRQGFMQAPSTRSMAVGKTLHGVRKDGQVFPVKVSLAGFEEGGRTFVQATVIDVSPAGG